MGFEANNYYQAYRWSVCYTAVFNVVTQRSSSRPVALRGHVTNAFFKRWVGILLMPKIDRAHKNYLTPEIWEETHLREIFYGTLIFQQSSMICIGRHVGGHITSRKLRSVLASHRPAAHVLSNFLYMTGLFVRPQTQRERNLVRFSADLREEWFISGAD